MKTQTEYRKCPFCGDILTKGGHTRCGKTWRQVWKCARRSGCGRVTINPGEICLDEWLTMA